MSDLCNLTCEACREGAPKVSQEEQLSLIEKSQDGQLILIHAIC